MIDYAGFQNRKPLDEGQIAYHIVSHLLLDLAEKGVISQDRPSELLELGSMGMAGYTARRNPKHKLGAEAKQVIKDRIAVLEDQVYRMEHFATEPLTEASKLKLKLDKEELKKLKEDIE